VLPAKVKKTGSLHNESNPATLVNENKLGMLLQCVSRVPDAESLTGKGF
jgi:hypothetical protein